MLDTARSRIWEAMQIGPQWLLRDTEDPLLDEMTKKRLAPAPARETVVRPNAPLSGTPAAPASRVVPPRTPVTHRAPRAGAATHPAAGTSARPADNVIPIVTMPEATMEAAKSADWETLRGLADACRACPMGSTRQHMVFAEEGREARFVIVGEAPGGEEDFQGIPFVGKSGQLLTAMLNVLGIERRKDVTILNVLKCRPPGNRNPKPDEVAACSVFLRRQLEILQPDVLFLMGRFAVTSLLNLPPESSIGRTRGTIYEVRVGAKMVPAVTTYHPSYLLRRPEEKAKSWEDLVLLKQTLARAGITFGKKDA